MMEIRGKKCLTCGVWTGMMNDLCEECDSDRLVVFSEGVELGDSPFWGVTVAKKIHSSKAAYEFDRMAKRIDRHLKQRSEMLSGISHDLRTPLTRLKLQLAMLNQKNLSEKMSKDIDEMEKMLNDYLQFAKTQTQENTSKIDLTALLNSIKNQSQKNEFPGPQTSKFLEFQVPRSPNS